MTHAYVHKSAVCKENNDLPVACWIPCTPVGAEACMLRACYMQILPARKASNQIQDMLHGKIGLEALLKVESMCLKKTDKTYGS